MADPHIRSDLDVIDKITVSLYRSSFLIIGIYLSLIICPLLPLFKSLNSYHFQQYFESMVCICALVAGCCVHIYNKTFRWILQGAALFSAIWFILDLWAPLAVGAALVTFSGLAIKEYFCFRHKILLFIPPLMITLWFSTQFLGFTHLLSIVAIGISAFFLMVMGFIKWRMPMDFDIGDRSKYQI